MAAAGISGISMADSSEERPIIQEILERLEGEQPNPHPIASQGRIEGSQAASPVDRPADTPVERPQEYQPKAASQPEQGQQRGAAIPLFFDQYIGAMRQLQAFQAAGDDLGYRDWLRSSTAPVVAVVRLRQLEGRLRQRHSLSQEDEYYQLALKSGYRAEQMAELHQRIRRYDRLQQLIRQFSTQNMAGLSAQARRIVQDILPDLLLIFRAEWKEQTLRQEMQSLLEPLFDGDIDTAIREEVTACFGQFFRAAQALSKM